MTMQAQFRPEAHLEIQDAKDWYDERSPGLGFEFVHSLDVAIQSALRAPLAFQKVESDCRRILMRRFPYSIIYRPQLSGILIVTV